MKTRMTWAMGFLNTLVLAGLAVARADAALVFNISQEDGAVVVVASGTLDVNATLGLGGLAVNPFVWLHPANGTLGLVGNDQSDYYSVSAPGWSPFGTGAYEDWLGVGGVVSSGDRIALFSGSFIGVPRDYVSGARLHGTATFPGDYATWGVTPGTYVTRFESEGNVDRVTVHVRAIPEPGSCLLAGLGGFALAIRRHRRFHPPGRPHPFC